MSEYIFNLPDLGEGLVEAEIATIVGFFRVPNSRLAIWSMKKTRSAPC